MMIMTITTTAIIPPITPPAIAPALLPPLSLSPLLILASVICKITNEVYMYVHIILRIVYNALNL